MSAHDIFNGFLLVLLGIALGARIEASNWRSKAKSGFRMESKGRLYRVDYDDE